MKYPLDANAVIGLLKTHPVLTARLQQFLPQDFGVPAVAIHELFYGAYKSRQMAQNLARVGALQFEVLEFDR